MADTAPVSEPSTHTPAAGGVNENVDGKRIFVGNVSFGSTEEQVREFVKQAGGTVTKVELPTTYGGRPGGFAFVEYAETSEASNAIEKLQGLSFNEREVTVALAKPDSVKKKEKAEKAAARKSKKKAEKAAAAAEAGAGQADNTAAAQSSASAGVAGPEAAEKAPKKKAPRKRKPARRQPGEEGEEGGAEEVNGRQEKANEARIDADGAAAPAERKPRAPREKKFQTTGELSKTMLFVANLPFDVDDAALSKVFSELSIPLKSARVITKPNFRNREGPPRSKGFGFVEVQNEADQAKAVEKLTGYKLGDREMTIKVANTREPIASAEGTTEGAAAPEAQ